MQNYLAIIGDMIASKKISDREAVQEVIRKNLEYINKQGKSLIVSKFTLTLGDEFQAVLQPEPGVWELLDILVYRSKIPLRFGLGYGAISTQIDPEVSLGADGEAYWNARSAIEQVHVQNWNGKCNVLFRGPNSHQDELINVLILASETIKSDWVASQQETFAEMLELGIYSENFQQKDIAKSLGISESALSKRLTNGNIKVYLKIREILADLLEQYGKSQQE